MSYDIMKDFWGAEPDTLVMTEDAFFEFMKPENLIDFICNSTGPLPRKIELIPNTRNKKNKKKKKK